MSHIGSEMATTDEWDSSFLRQDARSRWRRAINVVLCCIKLLHHQHKKFQIISDDLLEKIREKGIKTERTDR